MTEQQSGYLLKGLLLLFLLLKRKDKNTGYILLTHNKLIKVKRGSREDGEINNIKSFKDFHITY